MLSPLQYFVVLFAVCAYAFVRGRSDERTVATICVIASIASVAVISPLASRYSQVEAGVFIVDLATFAGFTFVALRSERFWPLWVAGLQLTTSIGHLLKGVDHDLLPRAYGAALQFWGYPILIILAVGTYRQHQRVRSAA